MSAGPVAGLPAEAWLGMWTFCHNVTPVGFLQWSWPDGGTALEQPSVLIQAFRIIGAEFGKAAAEKLKE